MYGNPLISRKTVHCVVRTWPWVLVGLVALFMYPEDRELGYPRLMLDLLPAGILGLVIASLVAATVSTLINWGASYLTNDLYVCSAPAQA